MKPIHLADILNQGLDGYQQNHKMSVQQKRVCEHIQSCRTGELGYQKWQCDQCGHQTEIGCSCRIDIAQDVRVQPLKTGSTSKAKIYCRAAIFI